MPNPSNAPPNTPSANRQRRQARMLLVRLQWLLILLLIIALVWLYVSQQRFQNQVNERLQSHEQIVSRLNEMDDRLFAISQQTLPKPNKAANNQAQNQLDLLRIQIQAADRLLAENNYSAAIEVLRSLEWQLAQNSNEIAPALTVLIRQSLTEDIDRLQAQSSQPSAWQLQNVAIQNIQEFLHSYERGSGTNSTNNANSRNKDTSMTARTTKRPPATSTMAENSVALTRQQLAIHEAIMTLNLAIQASNMREQEQLTAYLRQARQRLQMLTADTLSAQASDTARSALNEKKEVIESEDRSIMKASPANIEEVIVWLDELIANAPTATPLSTTQILQQQPLAE